MRRERAELRMETEPQPQPEVEELVTLPMEPELQERPPRRADVFRLAAALLDCLRPRAEEAAPPPPGPRTEAV